MKRSLFQLVIPMNTLGTLILTSEVCTFAGAAAPGTAEAGLVARSGLESGALAAPKTDR